MGVKTLCEVYGSDKSKTKKIPTRQYKPINTCRCLKECRLVASSHHPQEGRGMIYQRYMFKWIVMASLLSYVPDPQFHVGQQYSSGWYTNYIEQGMLVKVLAIWTTR